MGTVLVRALKIIPTHVSQHLAANQKTALAFPKYWKNDCHCRCLAKYNLGDVAACERLERGSYPGRGTALVPSEPGCHPCTARSPALLVEQALKPQT